MSQTIKARQCDVLTLVFAALCALFAGAAAVSCGDDAAPADAGVDGGASFDTGITPAVWKISTIDETGGGQGARIAVGADGAPVVAYFPNAGTAAGPCTELNVQPPPDKIMWDIYVSTRAGGAWTRETAAQVPLVGVPVGLSLVAAPDGKPALATMTGAPVAQIKYCGANDAGYLRPDAAGAAWTIDTAAANSGEAATGDAASDFGFVVGYWPALAFDPGGNPAIAYKDVHAGGMQSDDFRRADLELAWSSGGAWRHIPVDMGRGAGNWNALVFDAQARPVIAYYVPQEGLNSADLGVWATRSADQGATWEKVQLFAGSSQNGIAAVVNPKDGSLNVAFYDAVKGLPKLARLTDDSKFADLAAGWTIEEFGDHIYDEGYYLSLGVDAQGRIVAAYYRCVRASAGIGSCDPNDDGVVVARREVDGRWARELVDAGGEGVCGISTSMAIEAKGGLFVAYQCSVNAGGTFAYQLKLAELAAP